MSRFAIRSSSLLLGITVVLSLCLCACLAPLIATHNPLALDLSCQANPPSWQHLFGTDAYGRDVFSRVIYGARVSLLVGFATAAITGLTGTSLGLLAGYYPCMDNIIMRVMDAQMALPAVLLAIVLMAVLRPSALNIVLVLSIVYSPRTTRLVRGSVLSIKTEGFVEASRAISASDLRIFVKDLLPNCASTLIVQQTVILAYAILIEASLSFLGLGVPPPRPSWGSMLSEGRSLIRAAPWIVTFPGIAIMITVLGLNLIGDGLRDILDPVLRAGRFGRKTGS